MDLKLGREHVCCMQADDVGYSQGWGKEHIVEGDQGSMVSPDMSFPFLEAEQWGCSKVSQVEANRLREILNVMQVGRVTGAVGVGCTV